MDQRKWIGKVVKIELLNGKYYKGTVESEDDNFIFIIDINERPVTIGRLAIAAMWEVGG